MPTSGSGRPVYFLWGYHGGYVLAGRALTAESIAMMYGIARRETDVFIDFDFESYTLDRMHNGANLDVEKTLNGDAWKDRRTLAKLRALASEGRLSIVSTYTQPFMFAVDGESIVRQFAWARRITRETLGIEFDTYWAQEPCWFGQLPAVLAGFGFKGVYFCNSWAVFGACPIRLGEKFMWRGPDGSEIATIPRSPYASQPVLTRPGDPERWDYWQHGVRPTRERIAAAFASGIEHPVFGSLGKDLFPRNTLSPHVSSKDEDTEVEVEMTSLAKYLDIARHDGVWEDAFAEFDMRFAWGLWGGYSLRDQRDAADAALLAERLEVVTGADWRREMTRMWELAMLAQHHDYWALLVPVGGPYTGQDRTWADMPGKFLEESRARLAKLLKRRPSSTFALVNPGARERWQWTAIDLEVPDSVGADVAVKDGEGRAVASRLRVEPAGDAAARRARGYIAAEVAAFTAERYRLTRRRGEAEALPTFAEGDSENRTIGNGELSVRLSDGTVKMLMGGREVISGVHLHGRVDGREESSAFEATSAEVDEDGFARARAEGRVGALPFALTFSLAPWGEAVEVKAVLDFSGQRVEGETFQDMSGSLKIVFEHPRAKSHLSNQAFELRRPARKEYFAVHYAIAGWLEGGFAAALDRPSGVIFDDERLSIVLAHSGAYPYGVGCDKSPMGGNDIITSPQAYDLAIVPFAGGEMAGAVHACEERRLPLVVAPVPSKARAARALPRLSVTGRSIVSSLYREGEKVVLRLWNPFDAETVQVRAPGMSISTATLEGKVERREGSDAAEIPIGRMQIRTLLLERA